MNELFIPVPGLQGDEASFELGGLRFARLEPEHWELIEKNWLVDLYRDLYSARPRYYVVWRAGDESELERALAAPAMLLERVLLAARLVGTGTLVDARSTTPVLRTNAGLNTRLVDPARHRLYGTIFGGPIVLRPKLSEHAEMARVVPPRTVDSSGAAYLADASTRAAIERTIALLTAGEQCGADRAIAWVTRNFTRGHDIFLPARQRLICLFSALEATLGSYGRPKQRPSLGLRVQALFDRYAEQSRPMEELVETQLRGVRNALAHGADHRRGVDLHEGIGDVQAILRVAVPLLIRVAIALQQKPLAAGDNDDESELTVPGAALVAHLDGSDVKAGW